MKQDSPSPALRVLKFGGTSVGSAERIQALASLIAGRADRERLVVVVSALSGVTNDLIDTAQRAARGERVETRVDALGERHRAAARSLASPAELNAVLERLEQWLTDLHSLLHGVSLVRDCSPR